MSQHKLLLFAAAALLGPAIHAGVAVAEIQNSQVTVMVPAPKNDKAPVTGTAPNQRLQRQDQGQAGNEMTSVALFGDGKNGLYIGMTTELNGVRAPNRVQLSVTKFSLVQDATTGAVSALPDIAGAKFATNNNGNERRNANNPTAHTINGGTVICGQYNYQANNINNTVRQIQCWNQAGATVLPQTPAFAKNGDDLCMHQDGSPGVVVSFDKATATTTMVQWCGGNGSNADDGWLFKYAVKCNSADAPTSCTFENIFDVSLCPREERSRGACTVAASDPSYAVCSWTEGDTQPQRDGVWLAAVDLSSDARGANQQQTILWKKQIAGRLDTNGIRTYAQRATQERVPVMNPTTKQLEASDTIIYRYGDASGANNNNDGKGGFYRTNMLSVIKLSRTGMTYVVQPTDMATELVGLGGTHLGAAAAMFGTTDNLMPGLVLMNGSHTGGVTGAQIRAVGYDQAAARFVDLGMRPIGPHDRHLYSNYQGNNPGNQGRNHSDLLMVANPFVGQAGNTDAYLLLSATSAKTMADATNPAIKLTGLLSVTGIAQTPKASGGGGPDPGPTSDDPDGDGEPGTTLGGCSTSGGSAGFASALLAGVAVLLGGRRRRRRPMQ